MLATALMASAHRMKLVSSELEVNDGKWTGAVYLEAWALDDEYGPKVPPRTPGEDDFADADWAASLEAKDYADMKGARDGFPNRKPPADDRWQPSLTLLRLEHGLAEDSETSSLWTWVVAGLEPIVP